jgi:hypothetical protein
MWHRDDFYSAVSVAKLNKGISKPQTPYVLEFLRVLKGAPDGPSQKQNPQARWWCPAAAAAY